METEAKETNKRSEKQNVEENIIIMTESIGITPNNKTPTKAANQKQIFPAYRTRDVSRSRQINPSATKKDQYPIADIKQK